MQGYLYSVFLGGPGIEMSEIFLIRTHGHASYEHGVHVYLPIGTTAAIHMHHTICCMIPLVGKLLLGKELFLARVPDGQRFISEDTGAIWVLHHGILGDLTQLFKHVNHIFNHAHFQISLCFDVNWNLCGVEGKN